jgi:hypothetical protein
MMRVVITGQETLGGKDVTRVIGKWKREVEVVDEGMKYWVGSPLHVARTSPFPFAFVVALPYLRGRSTLR